MSKLKTMTAVLFSSVLLVSCASTKLSIPGEKLASTLEARMDVSAEVVEEYSDQYNLLFQVNFENEDGRWLRIDSVDFDFANSDNEPYNVIVGNDLQAWSASKEDEAAINNHNENIKMASIYGAGAVATFVGAARGDSTLTALGVITMESVRINAAYKVIKNMQGQVQGVARVPSTHLLVPFTIPSKSLVKRWILVNFPTGRVARAATLKLVTVEGGVLNYRLHLAKK